MKSRRNNEALEKGQALIELFIGLAIGGIILGSVVGGLALILRSSVESGNFQRASLLAQELVENTSVVAEAEWNDVYDLSPKGSSTQYRVATSGAQLVISGGTQSLNIDNATYTRFFAVENVMRDGGGAIVESGGTDDPSTQKITAKVQWIVNGQQQEFTVVHYLTRWKNFILRQTNWNGGGGQDGPFAVPNDQFSTSSNIDFSSSPGSIKIPGF